MNALIDGLRYPIDVDGEETAEGRRMFFTWDGATPDCPECGDGLEPIRVSYDPPTLARPEATPYVICDCGARWEVQP